MNNKHWSIFGLALGVLVLGVMVGLMTVGTVAADPTPGVRIQIPRIDIGDVLGTGDWETWIQVQNVSPDDTDTGAIFFGWGEYSELCPSNAPGPIAHYCQLIRGNAIWTLRTQLAEDIKSGIIYSVRADAFQEACDDASWAQGNTHRWLEWEKEWANGDGIKFDLEGRPAMTWGPAPGEDLAVTVTRYGPNDYGTFISSTYTGISEEMEGTDAPYEYYAPYVMKGYNGLDTELTIQNSGQMCTSVWIDYMEQGNCNILYKHHIEQLAPGESIKVRVPCTVGQIPCFWLGSAHIAAEQPLGIVVDETSFDVPCGTVDRGTLLTHRARPKMELRDGAVITDTTVYADLIFREWSGWDASIQVQNLSPTRQHTFVTVDFMDNSGDEILFLADWVCGNGSTTFYLPIINDLGFDYIGAAEITSHSQIDYPGGRTDAQPIFAVVDLKKPDNPLTPEMDAQGGSYNAHPESQKELVTEIALPFMAKDARDLYTQWTSMIAIRNNSNCNKIKPKIWFKDETGTLLCELTSFWLQPKHVKLIDLNNIGCLYPGYMGAAKVIVEQVEQLCDTNMDGVVDQAPVMPSVIVVEKGILGAGGGGVTALAGAWGDVTNIYEGIPYKYEYWDCNVEICGQVVDELTLDPINGAEIYTIERVKEGPFTVSGTAYISPTVGCPHPVGNVRLAGATVELQVQYFDDPNKDGAGVWRWKVQGDTTTDSDGYFEFEDALELEVGTAPTVDEDGDERAYRLNLSVQANGSTVGYRSGEFYDICDVEMDFTIKTTVGGGLDLTTGTWCPENVADCFEDLPHTTTDSTGHYCFTYGDDNYRWDEVEEEWVRVGDEEDKDAEIKTAEPKNITVVASADDYDDRPLTMLGVECEDKVVNFELQPECDTVWVYGYVEDKMTGEYINGATVMADNCVAGDTDITHFGGPGVDPEYYHDGYYELELTFDPECTTWVGAFAEDYNSSYDSVFIPICDTAAIDFQLRQTPKAKVLLYYGNGGVGGNPALGATDPITYTHLAAYFDSLGKTVDYTDVWPTQFDWTTKYELIVLLGPGHDTYSVTVPYSESVAVNGFTWGQKADLDSFLQQDGKLVILSDATSFTGNGVENDLLAALPVDLSFDQHDFEDGHGDQIVEPNTPPVPPWSKCLTNLVQVYSTADSALPDNWTDVTAGALAVPGNLILQNHAATYGADQPMYAADIPSHGNGWVAILGDMHGLSDGAWMSDWNWSADNEDVARNWLVCDP